MNDSEAIASGGLCLDYGESIGSRGWITPHHIAFKDVPGLGMQYKFITGEIGARASASPAEAGFLTLPGLVSFLSRPEQIRSIDDDLKVEK